MYKPIDPREACDMLEIQRVLFANFRATDEKDWALFETTLAVDVMIEFVGFQPRTSVPRTELRSQSEPNYAHIRTQHMSTNLDIRVDGDRATSTSYGHARHEYVGNNPAFEGERNWHIYARYENYYVRTTEGWKIAGIRMEPRWQEGDPKLLAKVAGSSE